MPTFKRKPYSLVPVPDDNEVKANPEKEVWVCRITGEVFDDFETYFNHFNLYRQRTWMCTSTGKTQLTYEEAVNSERKARKLIEEGLPDIWKKAVLSKANYATERLDHVVDLVHASVKDAAFVGEDIQIEYSQWTSHKARIIQAPDTTDDSFSEPHVPPKHVRIRRYGQSGEPEGDWEIIPMTKVKRDRIAFSKQNFKRFLKENTTRELWPGAPMVVKPDIAARLGISMEIPPAIQDLYRRRMEGPDYRPPRALNVEPDFPTQYPIDDTQLWKLINEDPKYLEKHGGLPWVLEKEVTVHDASTMGPRPEGRKVPSGTTMIPTTVLEDVLYVYNFLIVFCKPLNLYPFNFDDFLHALTTYDSRNDLLAETISVLLKKAQKMREDLAKAAERAKAEAAKAAAAAAALAKDELEKERAEGGEDDDGTNETGTPAPEDKDESVKSETPAPSPGPALKIPSSTIGSSPLKASITAAEAAAQASETDGSAPVAMNGKVDSHAADQDSKMDDVKKEDGEQALGEIEKKEPENKEPLTETQLVAATIEQNINFIRAWTAFPWHQYTSAYAVKGAPAPNPLRLKGWQAGIASAIVEIVSMLPGGNDPEALFPGYHKIMGKMLEVIDAEEEDEGLEKFLRREAPPHADLPLPSNNPYAQHLGIIPGGSPAGAAASPVPADDSSMADDASFLDEDELDMASESDGGYAPSGAHAAKSRSAKNSKKRKAAEAANEPPLEPEFHDPTKRRRLGAGMYDESRNVLMPGVQRMQAFSTAQEAPQALVDPVKKSHKKKAPEVRFLDLCERGWNRLKMGEKLAMLKFLIEEVITTEDIVRKYMDQAEPELNVLRKYRMDLANERGQLLEMREELEAKFRAADSEAGLAGGDGDVGFALASGNRAGNVTEDADMDDDPDYVEPGSKPGKGTASRPRPTVDHSDDEEIDFEESEEEKLPVQPKIPSARQADAIAAAKQRQAEEKARKLARAEVAKQQKERARLVKLRADERRKLDDRERDLSRRETIVERQYRGWSAVAHGRPMGRDRWFNRYWWFDSWFGGGVADFAQTESAKGRKDTVQGGPLQRWAMGKIWIEVVGPEDITDPTWAKIVDNPRMLDAPAKEWTFIETEAELDALMKWLNPRGEREYALLSTLKDCADDIKTAMKKREEYVGREPAGPRRGRPPANPHGSHQQPYLNKWASGFPKDVTTYPVV